MLVGHSFGGMTISAAAGRALDVTQLVYVAAYVPESGESMETLALSDGDNSFTEESFVIAPDYSYAEILERDRAAIFGNEGTEDQRAAIVAGLIREPLAPIATPVTLTEDAFGSVPQAYIRTLQISRFDTTANVDDRTCRDRRVIDIIQAMHLRPHKSMHWSRRSGIGRWRIAPASKEREKNGTMAAHAGSAVTGALVPLQLAFNGQLGGVTRNAFTASLIVFLVGALVLTIIVAATRPNLPTVSELVAASKTVWLGGAIATGYIIAIVVLTPRLGVGLTTGLILVGQIITALVLDHLGAFGNAQHTLNAGRLAGLALMIAGIATIKMY